MVIAEKFTVYMIASIFLFVGGVFAVIVTIPQTPAHAASYPPLPEISSSW